MALKTLTIYHISKTLHIAFQNISGPGSPLPCHPAAWRTHLGACGADLAMVVARLSQSADQRLNKSGQDLPWNWRTCSCCRQHRLECSLPWESHQHSTFQHLILWILIGSTLKQYLVIHEHLVAIWHPIHPAVIPDICHFFTLANFEAWKFYTQKCVNSRQKLPRDKTA